MSNVTVANFIKGITSAYTGYMQGRMAGEQIAYDRRLQEQDRELRRKEIERRFLASDRTDKRLTEQMNLTDKRLTEQMNLMNEDRDLARADAAEAKKLGARKEEADFLEKEALLYQNPGAYYPRIRAVLRGEPAPEMTSPPVKASIPSVPGSLPGLGVSMPGLGTTLPGATGDEALRRERGYPVRELQSEEKRNAERLKAEERAETLRFRNEYLQSEQERKKGEFAVGKQQALLDDIEAARKSKSPEALASAYREHYEFVQQNRRYLPTVGQTEAERAGYRFSPQATSQQVGLGDAAAPYFAFLPGGELARAGLNQKQISVPGMETPAELYSKNLELAGKELKLERQAARESLTVMRDFMRTKQFDLLSPADKSRYWDRFGDRHDAAGLPRPPAVNFQAMSETDRLKWEDQRLDRELDAARLEHQKKVQGWREGQSKAMVAASGGNNREAITTAREVYRQTSITIRQLEGHRKKNEPVDESTLTEAKKLQQWALGVIQGTAPAPGGAQPGSGGDWRTSLNELIRTKEKEMGRKHTETERHNVSEYYRKNPGELREALGR